MPGLFRIEELRALEGRARAGLAAGTLMQRAGRAAARALHEAFLAPVSGRGARRAGVPRPGRVLLLCGPGDNGGDGFECALALREMGAQCRCWAPFAGGGPDAQAARQRWLAAGGSVETALPREERFDVIVDALLGIGASRPLSGDLLEALQWARQREFPIVALDVPSGIDADTGTWLGQVAGAPARLTVTFLGDKPGLHLRQGAAASGRVQVAPLDVDARSLGVAARGRLNSPREFRQLLAPRDRDANKGSFGTVQIVGGATGMAGAALLAGRAALRLGAGKVFVDILGAPDMRVDPLQPELMLQPGRSLAPTDTLVMGCGMGREPAALALLGRLLAHPGPAVFDADALNAVAADARLRDLLRARNAATVLTPHPGEAARLLQTDVARVQADRVASATALAQQLRAVVVLKGAATVIAGSDGRYAINPTGNPALASAGTGDVLAGMLGALLAQCADPLAAACAAAWLHGSAADLAGSDVGLAASDIAPLAVRAWRALRSGAGIGGYEAPGGQGDAAAAAPGEVPVVRDQDQG